MSGDEWDIRCHTAGHRPIGTMSYPPGTEGYVPGRPHASLVVCGSQVCQDEARGWIAHQVGERATFSTFEANRAAGRARAAEAPA